MTPPGFVIDLLHLTWRGRLSMLWYRLRRLVVEPAPDEDRCFMGAPIGEHAWCPRFAPPDSPWCPHHEPREDQ